MTISIILLIAAFILFVIAAIGVPVPPRFSLIAAGLACWVLSIILAGGLALK